MVLQGEGRGKLSSPHLVKDFGDQNPPTNGDILYEMDKYINFHLLGYFRVRILDELYSRAHFMGRSHFANVRSGAF